jgi:hypothetical protein
LNKKRKENTNVAGIIAAEAEESPKCLSSSGTAKHSHLCQRHGSRLTKSLPQNDILDGPAATKLKSRIALLCHKMKS